MRSVLLRILLVVSLVSLAVPAAVGSANALPDTRSAPSSRAVTPASTAVADTAATSTAPTSTAPPEPAPVELPGRRTATSRTFVLPDGSFRTDVYTTPVNYTDADGVWRPIDNTLVPTDRDRFAVQNAGNDYRLLVPADAGTTPVRVESGGAWVSFAAQGADGAPQVAGDEASIRGGLGPNTALVYQARHQGVKEAIVLSAAPESPPSYTFDLHTSPGLTPRSSGDGGLELVDATGKAVFSVPAPFMSVSSGTDAGYSADVRLARAPAADGWTVTLTPDPGWLADPARVYPARIDPTVDINPQTDTWIDENAPDVGHGGGDYVKAGWLNGLRRRALLRFNLDDIPANVTVNSATLKLWLDTNASTPGTSTNYVARPVADVPWTRDATWNSYDGGAGSTWPNPRYITTADAGTPLAGTGIPGVRNFTVKEAVTGFINGTQPNNGLMLKQQTEGTPMLLAFFSVNHTTTVEDEQPKLVINYDEPSPPVFDKIGDRRFFTYEQQALDDRLNLKVNVANGNLLLSATDLSIAGTGLDSSVQRSYNSLAADTEDPSALGAGWALGDAPTVRLELNQPETGRVVFVGPTGYRVRFDRNASGGYVRAEPGLDAKLTRDDTTGQYTLEWFSKDKYRFNTAGQLTKWEDKQGNAINYTYNGDGTLDFLTDTQYDQDTNADRRIDFGYELVPGPVGPVNRLTSVTDVAGGRTYVYGYTAGRLTSSTLTSYKPELGPDTVNLNKPTLYGYDGSGRLNKVTDPMGNVTEITYDGATNRVVTIQREGLAKEDNDPATADADPITTFSYAPDTDCDTAANAVTVDGPRRAGDSLATDDADSTTYCHDSDDRVVKTIDANGHKRSTGYTTNSNVVSFNESGVAAGPAFGYTYSNNDNLTKVTLPQTGTQAPGTATAAYGDSTNPHFPTSVRDFATSKDSAAPATWDYDYDDNGYLIKARHDASADAPTITYYYCYDGKGQLQRIDPPPTDTTPDEDTGAGCGVANQGNDTLFTYFPDGNLQQIDPPGTHGTRTFTYDDLSRIKTMTDVGRGVTTTYFYDALDHITQLDFTGPAGIPGIGTVTYGYDPDGNMKARHDDTGNSGFVFNDLNQMTDEDPQPPQAHITYTYDLAGNMASVEASDEPDAVYYKYDKVNLVTSVTDQMGRETTFGYNDRDQRTSTTYPHIPGANSAVMKNAYDEAHRLVCTYTYAGAEPALNGDGCPTDRTTPMIDVEYGYTDPTTGLDTTTRYTSNNQLNRATTYDYDDIGRLKSAITKNTSNAVLRSYVYTIDKLGNITRAAVTGNLVPSEETRTFAFNDANEMCWSTTTGTPASDCATAPAGATSYGYDGAGELTSSSQGLSAGYNLQEQTEHVTPPGGAQLLMKYADVTSDRRVLAGTMRMGYNLLGLSAQDDGNNGVTHTDWFVRDPSGTLVSMIDRNDPNDNTKDRWYIFDGLGSVIGLVNNQGTLKETYTYEPYGQQVSAETSGDPNPWRYASGYYDKTTDMLKFGTRYDMPNLMRWTQMDPVAGAPSNPMTLNLYGYVGDNPTNSTDASGRDAAQCLMNWSAGYNCTHQAIPSGYSLNDFLGDAGACFSGAMLGEASGVPVVVGSVGAVLVPGVGFVAGAALGYIGSCAVGIGINQIPQWNGALDTPTGG